MKKEKETKTEEEKKQQLIDAITVDNILKIEDIKGSFFNKIPEVSKIPSFATSLKYEIDNREAETGLYHQKIRVGIKTFKSMKFDLTSKKICKKVKDATQIISYAVSTAAGYKVITEDKIGNGDKNAVKDLNFFIQSETLIGNCWKLLFSKRVEQDKKEKVLKVLLETLDKMLEKVA